MTLIAVIDYGIGNLRSAQKGLQRVGADARLTDDPAVIRDAAAVVLPGVGAFGACMTALRERGLDEPAVEAALSPRPFLGICVGMQLLYQGSEESPDTPGLGVVPGIVRRLPEHVKRPQMQWNVLQRRADSRLLTGDEGHPTWVYFVHSYAAEPDDHTVATCEYGMTFAAVIEHDNLFATQFHPEKSGSNGLRILANFVRQADRAMEAAG
jgi:imidazole glycerol-phosphate synthase subunit HisH